MASTKSKPKPRVAIYVGAAGSVALAAGEGGNPAGVPFNLADNIKAKLGTKAALGNAAAIAGDMSKAVAVALPAVAGIAVSVVADKLGVNRMLAKARMPFRV
mgnify:FL=1